MQHAKGGANKDAEQRATKHEGEDQRKTEELT